MKQKYKTPAGSAWSSNVYKLSIFRHIVPLVIETQFLKSPRRTSLICKVEFHSACINLFSAIVKTLQNVASPLQV